MVVRRFSILSEEDNQNSKDHKDSYRNNSDPQYLPSLVIVVLILLEVDINGKSEISVRVVSSH
jgi:hypothetical protein